MKDWEHYVGFQIDEGTGGVTSELKRVDLKTRHCSQSRLNGGSTDSRHVALG
jgi:hypothetical protein